MSVFATVKERMEKKTTLLSGEAKLAKREARVGGSKVALCRWTVLTKVRPASDLVDKPERLRPLRSRWRREWR